MGVPLRGAACFLAEGPVNSRRPLMLTKAEIQRLRSLREKKAREALGLFVIEGEKVIAELLAANFPLEEIYATPEWSGFTGEKISARGIEPGVPPTKIM